MSPALIALVIHFGLLSLLAFGGAGALTPEIHRVVVDQQGWLTERQFLDYFAIHRARSYASFTKLVSAKSVVPGGYRCSGGLRAFRIRPSPIARSFR